MSNEEQIRSRVEAWAKAAWERNWDGVAAWHHPGFVMYDVPPPFQSVGLDAYRKTWDLFWRGLEKGPQAFRVVSLQITAGADVAFCYAPMKCIYYDDANQRIELDFRLTIGFKKIEGEWWFIHEHHSVPSE